MQRAAAIQAIHPELERSVVVTIMGAVAAELQSIGHRPSFFYLQHAMGLASSVGLGLALSRPKLPVVVLDGDGSLLMNLGGLTTLARYRPGNLVHVVFDNESLLSVGGFPTATSTGSDLAAIARGDLPVRALPRHDVLGLEQEVGILRHLRRDVDHAGGTHQSFRRDGVAGVVGQVLASDPVHGGVEMRPGVLAHPDGVPVPAGARRIEPRDHLERHARR